ncbi:hypothetical protein ABZP36_022416 [Zizania latifolia]
MRSKYDVTLIKEEPAYSSIRYAAHTQDTLAGLSHPAFLADRPLFALSVRRDLASLLASHPSEGFLIRLISLYSAASMPGHSLSTFHIVTTAHSAYDDTTAASTAAPSTPSAPCPLSPSLPLVTSAPPALCWMKRLPRPAPGVEADNEILKSRVIPTKPITKPLTNCSRATPLVAVGEAQCRHLQPPDGCTVVQREEEL